MIYEESVKIAEQRLQDIKPIRIKSGQLVLSLKSIAHVHRIDFTVLNNTLSQYWRFAFRQEKHYVGRYDEENKRTEYLFNEDGYRLLTEMMTDMFPDSYTVGNAIIAKYFRRDLSSVPATSSNKHSDNIREERKTDSGMSVILHEGVKYVTTQMVADFHNVPKKNIEMNYSNNKDRFQSPKDFGYLKLTAKDGKKYNTLCFTESGYFKLVKSMGDAKAWDVYEHILEVYFRAKEVHEKSERINNGDNNDNVSNLLAISKSLLAAMEASNERANRLSAETKQLKSDVTELKQWQEKSRSILNEMEVAEGEPAEKSTRAKINEYIRAYAMGHAVSVSDAWRKVYHEFLYRYKINLTERAKNKMKTAKKHVSGLDIAEELKVIDDLYKVTCAVLKK